MICRARRWRTRFEEIFTVLRAMTSTRLDRAAVEKTLPCAPAPRTTDHGGPRGPAGPAAPRRCRGRLSSRVAFERSIVPTI